MMESTEKGTRKPLKLSRPGRLELKKTVESGQVKQSFSHGRSKTVKVEIKRKRSVGAGATGAADSAPATPVVEARPKPRIAKPEPAGAPATARPAAKRSLTEQERASRIRALEEARRVAEQEARRSEAEEATAALRIARETAERAELEERERLAAAKRNRQVEEENRRKAEEEARSRAEEAARRAEQLEEKRKQQTAAVAAAEPAARETAARGKGKAAARGAAKPRGDRRRGGGKLTISRALDDEGEERRRSVAAFRRRQEREKQRARQASVESQKVVRDVVVPETITVGELANRMAERGSELVKALMRMGVMATINQAIDQDTAELLVDEFGHRIRRVSDADVEIGVGGDADDDSELEARPPVVTVMGHVDHGKTSLLDALRQTDVAAGEAGGITQHIGACQITAGNGQKITFLDTPGHEAFTAMRQRGARVTDIVVLVVAADDGVRPQTVEAISHARAAGVTMIVAVNKIDKTGADPHRVKNELLSHEVVVEAMGGDVQCIEVSATGKTNLDKLEEAILLQSELAELRANPNRDAFGSVVEARLEKGRGAVATLLVQRGTLRVGDIFVAGCEWGRVRALIDDHGQQARQAGPSMPVEVLGLNGVPLAGDEFAVVENESRARQITAYRQQVVRDRSGAPAAPTSAEQMFGAIAAGKIMELPMVIKTDVQGSAEAIASALNKLATSEVRPRLLHKAVGGITESDVSLAGASGGFVVGFNVRANPQARDLAQRHNVPLRYYSVIYDVVDDITGMLAGKLAPKREEISLGRAEIREVFNISKVGQIAGCMVREGIMRRGAKARVLRDDVILHEGTIETLKRFKEDTREVRSGYECGMGFDGFQDMRIGDNIEAYEIREVSREL